MRDPLHPFTYPTSSSADVRARPRPPARRTPSTSTSTASPGSPARAASAAGGPRACTRTRRPARTATRRRTTRSPTAAARSPAATGSFMHNAYHMPQALGDQAAGDVMLITNETNSTNCANAGLFIIASLARHARRRRTTSRHAATTPGAMPRLADLPTAGKPGEFHGTVGTTHGRRLLGALVHGQGQHRRARQLRAGHALRRHLRPAQPAAGRLVPRPGAGRGRQARRARSSPATPLGAYWHGKYVYVADYAARHRRPQASTTPRSRQDPAEGVLELLRGQPDDRATRPTAPTAAPAARCRRRWR